ncbi:MAG: hypothetical protein WEC59_11105 [Salibacteraceae bacterium]
MILRKTLIIGLLFTSINVTAQGDRLWTEQHYFDSLSSKQTSIWGASDYRAQSNTLTNQLMSEALFQGNIKSSSSEFLKDLNSEGTTRLNVGFQGEVWYRHVRKNGPALLFGVEINENLYGSISNGLAQLYLKGNAPFEDQRLPLGRSKLFYMSDQSMGFGLEWTKPAVIYGANLNLIKVSRFQKVEIDQPSFLYTAPYGAQLDVQLAFDYHASSSTQAKPGAWYGTGAAADFYLILHPEDGKSMLSVQAKRIGMVHFSGSSAYSMNQDTVYTGTNIDNILALEDAITTNDGLDSLEALLGLEESSESRAVALPTTIQLDYIRTFSEKLSLAFQLKQVLSFGIPQARVGIAYKPKKWLALEPFFSTGGFSVFDLGLSASINVNNKFRLLTKYELLESQVASANSTSQALFLGGQLIF